MNLAGRLRGYPADLPARAWLLVLTALTLYLPAQLRTETPVPVLSLRSLPVSSKTPQTIRGVITRLGTPIYLQDRSGGIEIVSRSALQSFRIGDKVMVTGIVLPGRYSSRLAAEKVRLLRSRNPDPPLAVTPAMAASGNYDRIVIETQGVLVSESKVEGVETLVLHGSNQSFTAELAAGEVLNDPKLLRKRSLIRVQGVCVMSDSQTLTPVSFRLLLRSSVRMQRAAIETFRF